MSVTINDFGASGGSHSSGVVPDPGAAAGTSKFLREDATWTSPSGSRFFTDLAPSATSLTLSGGAALVQLSGGGNAILTPPSSFNGNVLTVKCAFRYTNPSGNITVALYFGNSTGSPTLFASYTVANDGFLSSNIGIINATLCWDSTTQGVYGYAQYTRPQQSSSAYTTVSINHVSASSSSDVKFVIGASTSGSGTLTLNQFSVEN